MKKIGLVSFFAGENYGAILQALALQKRISLLGWQSEYIDFKSKKTITGLKAIILNKGFAFVRQFFGYKVRENRTEYFRTQFLKRTAPICEISQLSECFESFDAFIVGSDQVWNPKWYNEGSGFYLLKSVNDKPRFSYASSFGVNQLSLEFKNLYKEELSKFNFISVRESTGVNILKDINIDSEQVLDPTFLLTKDDWMHYFDKDRIVKDKYIFCYLMNGDPATKYIIQYVKRINENLDGKYKIIIIGDKEYRQFDSKYKLVCDAGPSEFLNYLYNAEYVITNSFHGTCFSVNFQKKFTTILRRGNAANNRITDLLEKTDLMDHVTYVDSLIPNNFLPLLLDSKCQEKLNTLRKHSQLFLKKIVESI